MKQMGKAINSDNGGKGKGNTLTRHRSRTRGYYKGWRLLLLLLNNCVVCKSNPMVKVIFQSQSRVALPLDSTPKQIQSNSQHDHSMLIWIVIGVELDVNTNIPWIDSLLLPFLFSITFSYFPVTTKYLGFGTKVNSLNKKREQIITIQTNPSLTNLQMHP